MANQAYGFSLGVSTGTDENDNTRAFAQAVFVVLDDDSKIVQSPGGSDNLVLQTQLERGDTDADLRSRLVDTLRDQMEDENLAVDWMDEN